jgi:hypothetical protein
MHPRTALLFTTLLLPTLPALAQEKKDFDSAVYKVEFNIHDGADSAARTGRRYTMLIEANTKGTFRVGTKVPYATGSFQSGQGGAVSPLINTQYNYADVGVNIDCHLGDIVNGKLVLHATLDLSTLVPHDKGAATNPPSPTIAQLRIEINDVLMLGKPTLVASIDDPVTMRKFDVEVTVTSVN